LLTGDGIAVGIPTLIKRLHEGGRLQSIDQRRGRLKVRRMIDGRRLKVLHLRTDFLEHPIAEKSGPIGPLTGAKGDLPDPRDVQTYIRLNTQSMTAVIGT